MPEADDSQDGIEHSDWAPRIGQLSVSQAAGCAEGMHALARRLARHGSAFIWVAMCARVAIWLDRELAKVDPIEILAAPNVPLGTIPPQLAQLAQEIYLEVHDEAERGDREDGSDLSEVCLRVVVASGHRRWAPAALLELGRISLRRGEMFYAEECFEQLIPYGYVRELYEVAKVYMGLADQDEGEAPDAWTIAHDLLQATVATPSFRSSDAQTEVIELLTSVTNLMKQAGLDFDGGGLS